MDHPKYSLHLFAGAGGGLLADLIDGIQPVCAAALTFELSPRELEIQKTLGAENAPRNPVNPVNPV